MAANNQITSYKLITDSNNTMISVLLLHISVLVVGVVTQVGFVTALSKHCVLCLDGLYWQIVSCYA